MGMEIEVIKIVLGIVILILGVPIGNFLARITEEELDSGRNFFVAGILIFLLGAVISLILGNDILLFTFLFMAIVTSRSLKTKSKKNKGESKKKS